MQREHLEYRIQVTWDFVYWEKDRFVRVHRWARWIRRLHVTYRGGCTRGIRRDDMRVWSEKPGRREEKGKRDVNRGTSIEMALNWAYIASQYKYDTSVPVVFSTSVSLAQKTGWSSGAGNTPPRNAGRCELQLYRDIQNARWRE